MDNLNMFDWGPKGEDQMTWITGREIPFTKTPANVPATYVQTNTPDRDTLTTSTTTKKRKATATAAPTRKTRIAPAKRTRKSTSKKSASARIIPRSIDECCDADKTLISMRDSGEEWKAIRERWEQLTGEKTAVSTLPNRYARLKSNFTVIRSEDYVTLLMAKREVEESFEAQKWDVIAKCVAEKGGETYAGVVLKRQYKKLMLEGGVEPPPGIIDGDFVIEGEEDDAQIEVQVNIDADADAEMDDEE